MSSVERTKSTSTILEMSLSKELNIYLSNPKLSKELEMNTDESIELREQSVDDLLLHVEVGDQTLTEHLLNHLNIKQNFKQAITFFSRNIGKKSAKPNRLKQLNCESDLTTPKVCLGLIRITNWAAYLPLKHHVHIIFFKSEEKGTEFNVYDVFMKLEF